MMPLFRSEVSQYKPEDKTGRFVTANAPLMPPLYNWKVSPLGNAGPMFTTVSVPSKVIEDAINKSAFRVLVRLSSITFVLVLSSVAVLLTVRVPMELPGARVPPLTDTGPRIVPEPPSVPEPVTVTAPPSSCPFSINVLLVTVVPPPQELLFPARTTTASPSALNEPPLPSETVFWKVITVLVSPAVFPAVHSSATSAPRTVLEKFMRALGFTARIWEALATVIGPAQVTLLPDVFT